MVSFNTTALTPFRCGCSAGGRPAVAGARGELASRRSTTRLRSCTSSWRPHDAAPAAAAASSSCMHVSATATCVFNRGKFCQRALPGLFALLPMPSRHLYCVMSAPPQPHHDSTDTSDFCAPGILRHVITPAMAEGPGNLWLNSLSIARRGWERQRGVVWTRHQDG